MNLKFNMLLSALLASSMSITAVAETSSSSKNNPADSTTTSEVEKLAYKGNADAQFSVGQMYDKIPEWKTEQKPPFSADVWAFIKMVGPAPTPGR